jgi:hypothetical protein
VIDTLRFLSRSSYALRILTFESDCLSRHRGCMVSLSPSPTTLMHPALLLQDVVSTIVDGFNADDPNDMKTLLSLSTTSHVLSEAALDVIWADVDSWDLAQRMSSSAWTVVQVGGDEDFEDYELVSFLGSSVA